VFFGKAVGGAEARSSVGIQGTVVEQIGRKILDGLGTAFRRDDKEFKIGHMRNRGGGRAFPGRLSELARANGLEKRCVGAVDMREAATECDARGRAGGREGLPPTSVFRHFDRTAEASAPVTV
jgi:hypothetical protein